MIEFTMPALGSDMDEGTLDEWLIAPGDAVSRGQIVAVVETTKAAVEIECWHDGIVQDLLVPVGETVKVGTVLATLKETTPQALSGPHPPTVSKAGPPPRKPPKAESGTTAPHRRRWVSPAARRLASSLGVDVESVTGTGPQGAVTIADVEASAASAPQPRRPEVTAASIDRAAQMRKSIAAAMSRSKREIPHYYLASEVHMDIALKWMTQRNAGRPVTERLLPAALHIKAVGRAAQRFSEFNGFWRNDVFEPADGVHVGIAISLRGGGLVAPAIHDVPEKGLDQLMRDLTDLVARARAGSLRSSEMSDPSITVTNLGDKGVDTVFGVIYPPQVALVGFGTPVQRVYADDGAIRLGTVVHATLAADHRVSDGHRGALFLNEIRLLLEQPESLDR
ncbi:MAG TPA: dihydrolipoamide acetyltransferase family protein [Mycobacterium sp.]|nr:dihydrolipoamide acetyltransferase family protein [Mycobacterium sp.]